MKNYLTTACLIAILTLQTNIASGEPVEFIPPAKQLAEFRQIIDPQFEDFYKDPNKIAEIIHTLLKGWSDEYLISLRGKMSAQAILTAFGELEPKESSLISRALGFNEKTPLTLENISKNFEDSYQYSILLDNQRKQLHYAFTLIPDEFRYTIEDIFFKDPTLNVTDLMGLLEIWGGDEYTQELKQEFQEILTLFVKENFKNEMSDEEKQKFKKNFWSLINDNRSTMEQLEIYIKNKIQPLFDQAVREMNQNFPIYDEDSNRSPSQDSFINKFFKEITKEKILNILQNNGNNIKQTFETILENWKIFSKESCDQNPTCKANFADYFETFPSTERLEEAYKDRAIENLGKLSYPQLKVILQRDRDLVAQRLASDEWKKVCEHRQSKNHCQGGALKALESIWSDIANTDDNAMTMFAFKVFQVRFANLIDAAEGRNINIGGGDPQIHAVVYLNPNPNVMRMVGYETFADQFCGKDYPLPIAVFDALEKGHSSQPSKKDPHYSTYSGVETMLRHDYNHIKEYLSVFPQQGPTRNILREICKVIPHYKDDIVKTKILKNAIFFLSHEAPSFYGMSDWYKEKAKNLMASSPSISALITQVSTDVTTFISDTFKDPKSRESSNYKNNFRDYEGLLKYRVRTDQKDQNGKPIFEVRYFEDAKGTPFMTKATKAPADVAQSLARFFDYVVTLIEEAQDNN